VHVVVLEGGDMRTCRRCSVRLWRGSGLLRGLCVWFIRSLWIDRCMSHQCHRAHRHQV